MAIGGYRFQPGADQPMGGAGGQGRSVAPPSSSVKVLSYRMPKHDVRGSIAPAALLNGQGGGGATGLTPQLLALLVQAFSAQPSGTQNIFEPQGSSDPQGSVGPSSLPTPKFTIGDGGQGPFRMDDYGPPLASGGGGGEIPPMGGFQMTQPPDRSHVSPGPRYRMQDDNFGQPFGQPFDRPGTGHQFF